MADDGWRCSAKAGGLSKSGPVAPKKRATWDYKGRLEDMEHLALFLHDKAQTESSQLTVRQMDVYAGECDRYRA